MSKLQKYHGIFPAFYACYDNNGEISPERVRALTRHLIQKGVQGLYVGGSSGECIYQSVQERKLLLEQVMIEAEGKITVIAHVACNNTRDSQALAIHAESVGVDAIAAIPTIYFRLPEHSIAEYWNDISNAAPNTDFIIYNIPQLAGVALTSELLSVMKSNHRVIGVKNSSMDDMDIKTWVDVGGKNFVVFNGPDEQLLLGLKAGAVGGIGGTYAIMPELYLKIYNLYQEGDFEKAGIIQDEIINIINCMNTAKANLYAVMKGILKLRNLDIGSVRKPLTPLTRDCEDVVERCSKQISTAINKYGM